MSPGMHGDGHSNSDSESSSEGDQTEYPQMNPDLSMPGSIKQKYTVVVTGFGPFRDYSLNPSWEAVKCLQKMGIAHNINLITEEIPVSYSVVQKRIPELWKIFKPTLMVHVGVSGEATDLTIETIAHNHGYSSPDVDGKVLNSQCCVNDGEKCLKTEFKVDSIVEEVNQGPCLIMANPSCNAGRYLCEFIYYTSLNHKSDSTIFIHVPHLGEPYDAHEIADGIRVAIISMLKQKDLYHPLALPDEQMAQMSEVLRENSV